MRVAEGHLQRPSTRHQLLSHTQLLMHGLNWSLESHSQAILGQSLLWHVHTINQLPAQGCAGWHLAAEAGPDAQAVAGDAVVGL